MRELQSRIDEFCAAYFEVCGRSASPWSFGPVSDRSARGSVECNDFMLLLQKLCLRDARCSRSGCLAGSALDELLEGAREVLITAEQVLPSTVKRNRFELRWSRAIWDRFVGLAACNVAASLWLDLVIGR